MFGKCPECNMKLKKEELSHLKKGDAARCYRCGKRYVTQPLWIYIKLLVLALPLVVGQFVIKYLTLLSCLITFLTVVFYHEVQAYFPLIEEIKL